MGSERNVGFVGEVQGGLIREADVMMFSDPKPHIQSANAAFPEVVGPKR